MKVAIFGQYYQNDTRPIIKDIFVFFNANNIQLVIEENFLTILYEQKIVQKEYKTFNSHECIDNSFDIMVSIGGDGTILRAATYVRDSGVPIIGINAGRLGFLAMFSCFVPVFLGFIAPAFYLAYLAFNHAPPLQLRQKYQWGISELSLVLF